MDQIQKANRLGTRIGIGAVITLAIILVASAYTGHVWAEKQSTSIGKQRPQYDEIKQKVYTMIQGKIQEDRVATLMKQAHDQTAKDLKENSLKTTPQDTYNLKIAYQKVAEMKRQTDEQHRKVIMDKISLQTKMTQMKIDKMVKEGKLGKPEKTAKQFEYGRTQ